MKLSIFLWSWEDVETKNSNWAKLRKVWCAEHFSSGGLWCRLLSKLFSLHSLAKAQQFCCVQTVICKDLCFCLPQMMHLYEKAEGNWPIHWEMLVLVPNPMCSSEHQYSKEVQEEDRTHLWSAFLPSLSEGLPSLSEVKRRDHQNANVLCWEGSGMKSSTGLYVKFLSTTNKIYSLKTFQCSWNTCLLIYNLIWDIFW